MTKTEQQKLERLGETNYNCQGSEMTIIEYNTTRNIIVEFEDGYKCKNTYNNFLTGSIKSPYSPSVFNKGYLGIGEYKITHQNGKKTKVYETWYSMIRRCYDKKQHKYSNSTYINCTVCDEWLNYQIFAKWYDENYYSIEDETMCLDKDILIKGNKIYSPNTCIFVPKDINILFTKSDKTRGEYPIGVSYHKNTYEVKCNILKDNIRIDKYIGNSSNPKGAFLLYKEFKENYIKEVADYYKDKIPVKLYNAMYKWIVEITD